MYAPLIHDVYVRGWCHIAVRTHKQANTVQSYHFLGATCCSSTEYTPACLIFLIYTDHIILKQIASIR
jgi:hypothetical protein